MATSSKKGRPLLVLLLIVAFTAQSFAAVASSCPMMAGLAAEPIHDMQGMDHSGHDMHGMADTDNMDSVCCEGGACAMGHCLSSIALLGSPYSPNFTHAGDYASSPLQLTPSPTPSSLYRPPISR